MTARRQRVDPKQPHWWEPGGGYLNFGYAQAPLCRHCRQTLSEGPHSALEVR